MKIKTRDISDVASEVTEKKAFAATETILKLRKVADGIQDFSFCFNVMCIQYDKKSRIAFIPTGTSDEPTGISSTDSEIIAFIEDTTEDPVFPHLFHECISTSELKATLKKNWSKLTKKIGGDYKTLGVIVKV